MRCLSHRSRTVARELFVKTRTTFALFRWLKYLIMFSAFGSTTGSKNDNLFHIVQKSKNNNHK